MRPRSFITANSPSLDEQRRCMTQPTQLDRIEAKLDALLEALADEGEETERRELTLDGEAVGGERDDSQPL